MGLRRSSLRRGAATLLVALAGTLAACSGDPADVHPAQVPVEGASGRPAPRPLRVRICDWDGAPLDQAELLVQALPPSFEPSSWPGDAAPSGEDLLPSAWDLEPRTRGTTDPEGRAVLVGVPPGRWRLLAEAPGRVPRARAVEVTGASDPAEALLQSETGHPLHGRVLGRDGAPVAHAWVLARYPGLAPDGRLDAVLDDFVLVRADEHGRYRFEALPEADVELTCGVEDAWSWRSWRLRVPALGDLDLEIDVRGPVEGTLRGEDGSPVADADLRFEVSAWHTAHSSARARTDAGGRYRIPIYLAESLTAIEVSSPGWARPVAVAGPRQPPFLLPRGPLRLDLVARPRELDDLSRAKAAERDGPDSRSVPLEPQARIRGRVVADGRPGPLAHARVETIRGWVPVDAEGRFALSVEETSGPLRIALVVPGHGRANLVVPQPARGESLDLGDRAVPRGATLRGRVERSGEPVAGVVIAIEEAAGGVIGCRVGEDPPPLHVAVTDEHGRFEVGAHPAGEFDLVASLPGHVQETVEYTAAAGAELDVTVRLHREVRLRGRVRRLDGSGVYRAEVSARPGDRPYAASWTESDAAGSFEIRLREGVAHTLDVSAGEGSGLAFVPWRLEEFVPGDEPLTVVVDEGVVVHGRVLAADGAAVSGAQVEAEDERGNRRTTTTGGDGAFALPGMAEGALSMRAWTALGGEVAADVSRAGAEPLEMRLAPTFTISGLLLDVAGAPLGGWTLQATPAGSHHHDAVGHFETDPDGRFTLAGLAPGRYRVEEVGRAAGPVSAGDVACRPLLGGSDLGHGATGVVLRVPTAEATGITLLAVDLDGRPVEGVPFTMPSGRSSLTVGVTGPDGRASARGVPLDGTHPVRVGAGGITWTFDVPAGTHDLRVTVEESGVLAAEFGGRPCDTARPSVRFRHAGEGRADVRSARLIDPRTGREVAAAVTWSGQDVDFDPLPIAPYRVEVNARGSADWRRLRTDPEEPGAVRLEE